MTRIMQLLPLPDAGSGRLCLFLLLVFVAALPFLAPSIKARRAKSGAFVCGLALLVATWASNRPTTPEPVRPRPIAVTPPLVVTPPRGRTMRAVVEKPPTVIEEVAAEPQEQLVTAEEVLPFEPKEPARRRSTRAELSDYWRERNRIAREIIDAYIANGMTEAQARYQWEIRAQQEWFWRASRGGR